MKDLEKPDKHCLCQGTEVSIHGDQSLVDGIVSAYENATWSMWSSSLKPVTLVSSRDHQTNSSRVTSDAIPDQDPSQLSRLSKLGKPEQDSGLRGDKGMTKCDVIS